MADNWTLVPRRGFEPKSTAYRPRMTRGWTVLYRVMIGRWCRGEDSNLRPTHYECVALPAELPRQIPNFFRPFSRRLARTKPALATLLLRFAQSGFQKSDCCSNAAFRAASTRAAGLVRVADKRAFDGGISGPHDKTIQTRGDLRILKTQVKERRRVQGARPC